MVSKVVDVDMSDSLRTEFELMEKRRQIRKRILDIVEDSDFDTEYDIGDGITVTFKRPVDDGAE